MGKMDMRRRRVFVGLIVAFLGFTSCAGLAPEPCQPPAWFFDRTDSGEVRTGVGEGESLEEAEASALREIASQMSVWVDSTSRGLYERNGSAFESRFRHRVELESQHRLKNAKRLIMERCEGQYYVNYSVDLRPSAVLMAEALTGSYPDKTVCFTGSSAITGSPFITDVKRFMKQDNRKDCDETLSLSLTYENGIWCVHAGTVTLPVSDVSELVDLKPYVTGNMTMGLCDRNGKPRSSRLTVGDEFCFLLSSGKGYLSMFNVYADGRVSVVVGNRWVEQGQVMEPDPNKGPPCA